MNARGTRDIPPEEKIQKNKITQIVRNIFEQYGYTPLETPIITRQDVLFAKYSGGEEITQETFTLQDRGERDLGLRYDLTVPFAKYIGMNPNIKFPFKRYEIGKVFRDGPVKTGRFREFWQCDADVVGNNSFYAEVELMTIASKIFEKLKLKTIMEINSMQILKSLLKSYKIEEEKIPSLILTLDKIKKIPREEIIKELEQKGLSKETTITILEVFKSNISEAYKDFSKIDLMNEKNFIKFSDLMRDEEGKTELDNIQKVISTFNKLNKNKDFKLIFNPSLARGLSYYTGTVFEAFSADETSKIKSSLCGGGRYDQMIAQYLDDNNKKYPTVGMTIGLDVIDEVMKEILGQPTKKSTIAAYIVPINTLEYCLDLAEKLREKGVNVDLDVQEKGISKNLSYADYYKIPFVIIVGEEEISKGVLKLKNMISGEEEEISFEFASQLLKEI